MGLLSNMHIYTNKDSLTKFIVYSESNTKTKEVHTTILSLIHVDKERLYVRVQALHPYFQTEEMRIATSGDSAEGKTYTEISNQLEVKKTRYLSSVTHEIT